MEIDIYALTDSHQETRNLATLLSGVYNDFPENKEFLLLDCGDLFKGVYDRGLSVQTYLNFKKLKPDAKIFMTLGNNDFGFNQESFDYLKGVLNTFKNSQIKVVCANLKNSDGTYSNLVPRYELVNINGEKILITGFCLPTGIVKQFGLYFEDYKQAFLDIVNSINEKFDHIIILNHHWQRYSVDLYEFAKSEGFEISLIIGGHEHSPIKPDFKRNIYYPLAFSQTIYKMKLTDKIEHVKEIAKENFQIIKELENPIAAYEKQTELFKPIAKRKLNLWKRYSQPCPLGTFISDSMKEIANTDIAFHSTGMTMYHLKYEPNGVITNYDFKRAICSTTPIVKMNLTVEQLKKVLENATLKRMYIDNGNSRFLQCSHNVEITGKENLKDKTYKIIQITVNKKNLLDENSDPIDKNIKISCAIDEFIAKGAQGYEVLKNIDYTPIYHNNKVLPLNQLLYDSLLKAESMYMPDTEYPSFQLTDLS